MADSASTILLQRIQSVGSNVNLWGGYINTDLQIIERASKGYQAYTVTGTATISWTNYSETNDLSVAVAKFNGTPAAAWALTLPTYQTMLTTWNNSGQAGTFKNSGGTGITVPTGRKALLYGDGTDIGEASPNWLNSYATTLTNAGDVVVKATLETAIATASLPATAGTVLVSAADTAAGYLGTKVNITGLGAASVVASTTNPGASEVKTFAVSVGSVGLSDGGTVSGAGAVAVNTKYLCDYTASAYTLTLPAAPAAGDVILLTKYGTFAMTLGLNSLKFFGSTADPVSAGEGAALLVYTGSTRGWVEM